MKTYKTTPYQRANGLKNYYRKKCKGLKLDVKHLEDIINFDFDMFDCYDDQIWNLKQDKATYKFLCWFETLFLLGFILYINFFI